MKRIIRRGMDKVHLLKLSILCCTGIRRKILLPPQKIVFSLQFAVHCSHIIIDVTQTVDSELKTKN
jgi:hypothetical protein